MSRQFRWEPLEPQPNPVVTYQVVWVLNHRKSHQVPKKVCLHWEVAVEKTTHEPFKTSWSCPFSARHVVDRSLVTYPSKLRKEAILMRLLPLLIGGQLFGASDVGRSFTFQVKLFFGYTPKNLMSCRNTAPPWSKVELCIQEKQETTQHLYCLSCCCLRICGGVTSLCCRGALI